MTSHAERLVMLIGAASRTIRARSKGIKRGVPLSFFQLEALRYIKEGKKPLMKEVADYMAITPPSATFLIDGLVHLKMLKRHLDSGDRRAVRVSVTAHGLWAIDETSHQLKQKVGVMLGRLTKSEGTAFIKLFEKLSRFS